MAFLSEIPSLSFTKPQFCSILANTIISTVPGISGAGSTPEKTLLTPVLDAELVMYGAISSMPIKPNTPTGCPTPASITRAIMELTGLFPLFINAGLSNAPTVPCIDVYGSIGNDPRYMDAVPNAQKLFQKGTLIGTYLSGACDLLVLGECVPGGTTTALCVLRALGYDAQVSSSYIRNPLLLKEEICNEVMQRIKNNDVSSPLDVIRMCGDPMMAVAAGIGQTYTGEFFLAGGTQMAAVGAVQKMLGARVPRIVTTSYVRDDHSANIEILTRQIGLSIIYIDPEFGNLGHSGLARYCIGEVKEGMGAGGAMFLASLLGYSAEEIRAKIFQTVSTYT